MGPGDRFSIYKMHEGGFGFGIWFDRFPYDFVINIALIKWNIQLGLGKPYTENNYGDE